MNSSDQYPYGLLSANCHTATPLQLNEWNSRTSKQSLMWDYIMKKFLRSVARSAGYEIRKLSGRMNHIFDPTRARICDASFKGHDFRFFVENPIDTIQREHANGKLYEEEELDLIEAYFKPGVFMDVGTNVGNHAIYAAKALKADVIAFEPALKQHSMLVINMALNDVHFPVHKVALSDAPGEARMQSAWENNLGATRLSEDGEAVALVCGDDFLDKPVTFLKIDVEGNEIATMRGLQKTIARDHPVILIEVDNVNDAEIQKLLNSHGYQIKEKVKRYEGNINYLAV